MEFRRFPSLGNQPIFFGTWLDAQLGSRALFAQKSKLIEDLEMPQKVEILFAELARKLSKMKDSFN